MPPVRVLSEVHVRRLLDADPLMEGLEHAFVELSAGRTSVPPRIAAAAPEGFLGAMPGYLPGGGLAVKLVTVFPDNERHGRPSHQGVILLFDEDTGTPVAALDAIRITALRTAAAAAVAARLLAREDAEVLAILGAGTQGGSHLELFPGLRAFREVRVASRTRAHAEALAERAPRARVVDSFESAVRGADVVCCCTDSREPILRHEWLAPGAHVSSVGGSTGRELDDDTVRHARVFVEWRGACLHPPPTGAGELQGVDPDEVTELGEVLSGRREGRRSPAEVTVYKSTGHAVEDVVAARLVHERAVREGVGLTVQI